MLKVRSSSPRSSVTPLELRGVSFEVKNCPVFKRWDHTLFVMLTLLIGLSITYFFQQWLSFEDWRREPLAFGGITLLLFAFVASHMSHWFLLPFMARPLAVAPNRSWKVGIATTFVPGREPLDMLEKMVKALAAIRYPHDTWVLDEGNDDRVKAICRKYGAFHFSRKELSQYQAAEGKYESCTKYGNYNSWLSAVGFGKYEIVTAFDPDHFPDPEFLDHVLVYFESPRIGYVQVAQAYRNQRESWIARGAAEETYYYFSSIQMASYRLGYPILVGGHNTHRVRALSAIGGFAAHDADDILTTVHYRDAGWDGIYVPQILARGLNPTEWDSYLTQQRRWARSVLDLKLRVHGAPNCKAPLLTRIISFLHGFNYILKGLWPVVALGLLCGMCLAGSAPDAFSSGMILPLGTMTLALVVSQLFRQRFFLAPCTERGVHWRAAILRWAKWPQMLLALKDVILNRQCAYTITAKSNANSADMSWIWPHALAAALLTGCWIIGVGVGTRELLPWHSLVGLIVLATVGLCITSYRNSKPAVVRQTRSQSGKNSQRPAES
jgi:cellulose synthase (UDP-forming)